MDIALEIANISPCNLLLNEGSLLPFYILPSGIKIQTLVSYMRSRRLGPLPAKLASTFSYLFIHLF